MKDGRKQFFEDFKAKVAIEAIKGHRTLSEIASEYAVHPNQVSQWKKEAMTGLAEILSE